MNAATVAPEDFDRAAAAVRGDIRRACRRAAKVRGGENAILDTVVLMVTDVLGGRGLRSSRR